MKYAILILFISLMMVVNIRAQSSHYRAELSVGLPLGETSDVSSVVIDADVAYLRELTDVVTAGGTVGYAHYVGKEIESGGMNFRLGSDSFIPINVVGQYEVADQFSVEAGAGYAIGLNEGNKGGFNWNVGLRRNICTSGLQVGLGFNRISVQNDYGDNFIRQDLRLSISSNLNQLSF